MDYGWMSHALMWFIGVLSIGGVIGAFSALFWLGKSSYHKD